MTNHLGPIDRFGQLLTKGQCFDTMITRQALLSPAFPSNPEGFTDKELTQLCKYGLLLPHMKKDSYWFAIRRQGVFMSSFLKGRAEMLRILKKRSTKDIMEKVRPEKSWTTLHTHPFFPLASQGQKAPTNRFHAWFYSAWSDGQWSCGKVKV